MRDVPWKDVCTLGRSVIVQEAESLCGCIVQGYMYVLAIAFIKKLRPFNVFLYVAFKYFLPYASFVEYLRGMKDNRRRLLVWAWRCWRLLALLAGVGIPPSHSAAFIATFPTYVYYTL